MTKQSIIYLFLSITKKKAIYSLPDNSLYVPNGADMGGKLLDRSGYFGRGYLKIH